MAKVYYDKDANSDALKGKTIAVIGFGSQGHSQALNMKDSGLNVIIGLRPESASVAKAKKFGFKVMSVADATKSADFIQMLVPDEFMGDIYNKEVAPYLNKGKTLGFSHGFNIHFKYIVPPKDVNVVMVAPKGPGHMVRQVYTEGGGVPAIFAIEQDATGNARDLVFAYAKGIGSTRAGLLQTTFKEETETDLFGEQNVLCGGATALIKAGFETLIEAGYQPEIAYFECCHELKLIVDLIYKHGIAGMRYSISNTAEYGDLTVGPKIIDAATKARMKEALTRIQNGSFAKEFIEESRAGKPNMEKMRASEKKHPLEIVGGQLREMMPWLKGEKLL